MSNDDIRNVFNQKGSETNHDKQTEGKSEELKKNLNPPKKVQEQKQEFSGPSLGGGDTSTQQTATNSASETDVPKPDPWRPNQVRDSFNYQSDILGHEEARLSQADELLSQEIDQFLNTLDAGRKPTAANLEEIARLDHAAYEQEKRVSQLKSYAQPVNAQDRLEQTLKEIENSRDSSREQERD